MLQTMQKEFWDSYPSKMKINFALGSGMNQMIPTPHVPGRPMTPTVMKFPAMYLLRLSHSLKS